MFNDVAVAIRVLQRERRIVRALEVIELLEKELGLPAQIEWLPVQTGDVRRTWSDSRAAREALGFEPKVPLAQGIARFVAWLRERT